MKKVLFVCLGNICRSPMGEGVFKHLLNISEVKNKYLVDSAGTSAYHVGNKPDSRMRATALKYGFELESRARQVVPEDFDEFDIILAMDQTNFSDLRQLAERNNKNTDNFYLMRKFDSKPGDLNVPDPYYGSDDGFEEVYEILNRSNKGLLKFLEN